MYFLKHNHIIMPQKPIFCISTILPHLFQFTIHLGLQDDVLHSTTFLLCFIPNPRKKICYVSSQFPKRKNRCPFVASAQSIQYEQKEKEYINKEIPTKCFFTRKKKKRKEKERIKESLHMLLPSMLFMHITFSPYPCDMSNQNKVLH